MSVLGLVIFVALIIGVMYFSRKYYREKNPIVTSMSKQDLKIGGSGGSQFSRPQPFNEPSQSLASNYELELATAEII